MINVERLGWIVAAAVLGVLATSGFQGSMDKTAYVDLAAMVQNSDLGKSNLVALNALKTSREDLLRFIDENRVLTSDQVKNLRTLWLKESPSIADKASLESLKAEIVAQSKKNLELGQKPNLTPEERSLLQEYASRSASMEQVTQQWFQEFRQEVGQAYQSRQVDALNKAKAATQSLAKSQSYSLVFDATVATYAANDVTDDALKVMNAKK